MWMEDAFNTENVRQGEVRYLSEFRVHPYAGYPGYSYPGKGDLYDIPEAAVVDWKFLGDTSREKIINFGPPRKYFVQLLAYGKGFRNMGLPVKRVVLVAWPRTRSTLDKTYVWDHLLTSEDDELLEKVYQQTQARAVLGDAIAAGHISLRDVPAVPDDDDCYFCPFFRAEAARDPAAAGCPGHHLIPGRSNTTGP
jgi:hypothetical protein